MTINLTQGILNSIEAKMKPLRNCSGAAFSYSGRASTNLFSIM